MLYSLAVRALVSGPGGESGLNLSDPHPPGLKYE